MNFLVNFPKIEVNRLAVKLTPSAEKILLQSAHPWIYSKSIAQINKPGKAGDIAIIFGQKSNKVIGVGLYDPQSPIQIKMLHFYGGAMIDPSFFESKIEAAYQLRQPLLLTNTNSYRLLFGENDGLPGLIADVYNDVVVVKIYSAIWFPFLKDILKIIIEISQSKIAVLRLSRKLQSSQSFGLEDGMVVYGNLPHEDIVFTEHGVKFKANVIKGHKTGFFLDHRENRKKVGNLAAGKTVLDVFSYAGGFSVHALCGGAKEVTAVDISEQALEQASANAALNGFENKLITRVGDAFEILNSFIAQGKTFDLIVIDPPSFAKSEKEVQVAKKKYAQLAQLGSKLIAKNGILVLASCSSRVTASDFFQINDVELKSSGRKFSIIQKTFHDIDHPVNFKEGAYLKCAYYRLT